MSPLRGFTKENIIKMKKLALSIIIFTAISACNKKEKVEETPVSETEIVTEPETDSAPLPMSQNELSPDQVSDFLKSKSNDTLYVTNFFATWCGPCVREIPHFKEKMEELKNQPVKFTFISLDNKEVWNTKVPEFVDEFGIRDNTILLDGSQIGNAFFDSNFKTWRGETIPFTLMKKGDKSEEINGSISKEELENKLNIFQ